MAAKLFYVEFTLVSTQAYGDSQTRIMPVKANTAAEAENIAWMQRGTWWGAFGTDNAIDCVARA